MSAARALGTAGGGPGAARVLALLYDPDVDIDEVLDCLRSDPGLAARVLKVANAPYYRQAGNVGTVDRAVQVLGLTAIRGVAASGCLDRLAPPRRGVAFDPDRFRQHSLAVATAAQQLSRAAASGIDGEAYMAGLLHDIGMLLLVKVEPALMDSYAPPANADHAAVRAAEAAHFGVTHEDCALMLTQAWSMPLWLSQAIASHHDDSPQLNEATLLRGTEALPALLAVADDMAARAGFGLLPHHTAAPPLAAAASLGLQEEQVAELCSGLADALTQMQGGR
jgi:HD-like signal output (HDOD) protein